MQAARRLAAMAAGISALRPSSKSCWRIVVDQAMISLDVVVATTEESSGLESELVRTATPKACVSRPANPCRRSPAAPGKPFCSSAVSAVASHSSRIAAQPQLHVRPSCRSRLEVKPRGPAGAQVDDRRVRDRSAEQAHPRRCRRRQPAALRRSTTSGRRYTPLELTRVEHRQNNGARAAVQAPSSRTAIRRGGDQAVALDGLDVVDDQVEFAVREMRIQHHGAARPPAGRVEGDDDADQMAALTRLNRAGQAGREAQFRHHRRERAGSRVDDVLPVPALGGCRDTDAGVPRDIPDGHGLLATAPSG